MLKPANEITAMQLLRKLLSEPLFFLTTGGTKRQRRSAIPSITLLGLIALLMLPPGLLLSQINTATLAGIVTDSSGADVPGATVVIENAASQVRRTTQTNAEGAYSVPLLQPGSYEVTVS